MKADMTDFWEAVGFAMIILAILLGFGGCVYLVERGSALEIKAQHDNPSPMNPTDR